MSDSAFKNIYNKESVRIIAQAIKKQYPKFDEKKFISLSNKFPPLEMKDRVIVLANGLKDLLPQDYSSALKVLCPVIESGELTGFLLWPVSEYITQFGQDNLDESMKAMYLLTQKFTSEFAVRSFLLKNPNKVLSYFKKWVKDPNVHVRRWVSEGTRPVLPWGGKIPLFINNPHYTLPLLEALRFDEELYVRKSVSNHLNDITKTNPELVIETLKRWQKEASAKDIEKIEWIKRQALRTLIKSGNQNALKLMGAGEAAKVKASAIRLNQKKFALGETLEFHIEISSENKKDQKIVVDYIIDFVKANGRRSSKVFKLKTFEIKALEKITLKKKHSLKKITTMVYYKGRHSLSIQINGKVFATIDWDFHP